MANNSQKNTNGKDTELEEEKFIAVGEGATDLLSDHDDQKESSNEDESLKDEDSENTEDSQDSRLSPEAEEDDDEDRDRVRSFRRKRRKNARENVRRDRLELQFLRQQNDALEKRLLSVESRTQGNEIATVDSRINAIREQIRLADTVIAGAIESTEPGRGSDVVKAQGIRDQLIRGLHELEDYKNRTSKSTQTTQETTQAVESAPARPPLSEVQRRRAGQWFKENSWYNPKSNSPEVQQVLRIDREIESEGFDPSTEEYWDEFEDRVRESLPDLYSDDDSDTSEQQTNRRNSRPTNNKRNTAPRGPKLRVGGKERPLRPGEVYISPERRKALEDAGMWDDQILRNRMLKRYSEHDRLSSSRRSS